jgi:hypothetical protein
MSERTYKLVSAAAVCNRIWKADFVLDSFNELVERDNPDNVVATVGMSDYSAPDRRVSMVITLNDHPWMNEIADGLIAAISEDYHTLDEWSFMRRDTESTFTLKWQD